MRFMGKRSRATVLMVSAAMVGAHAQRGQGGGTPPDGTADGGQAGRGGRGGRGGGEGAPAAKPYVPTSAASLARNPNAFLGENVTLTAAAEQILAHPAFLVEQRRPASANAAPKPPAGAGKDVLLQAPVLDRPLE